MVGQVVGNGRFTLKRLLGQGGMGIVWLASDRQLREDTALKFLPPAIRADPTALDDLRRETQRSRRLTHPHIVRIHDLFVAEGQDAFIAMEYVDGHSLSVERLNRTNKVLEWEQLALWVRQLCEALDYAHREQIIHRDLKPSNLLLDGQHRLKLTDFGIARVVTDSVSRSPGRHGASGTTVYMSPQQLHGEPSLPTDDVYSLGATLYELLTGKPPFYTGDVEDQIRFRLPEPIDRRQRELHVVNPVPAQVARVIMACLAKDAHARPSTILEVAERLGLSRKTQRKAPPSPTPNAPEQLPLPEPAKAAAAAARPLSARPAQTDQEKIRPSKRRPRTLTATEAVPVEPPPVTPTAAPLSEFPPRPEQQGRRRLVWGAVFFFAALVAVAGWLASHSGSKIPQDVAALKKPADAEQQASNKLIEQEAKIEAEKQRLAAEKKKNEEEEAKRIAQEKNRPPAPTNIPIVRPPVPQPETKVIVGTPPTNSVSPRVTSSPTSAVKPVPAVNTNVAIAPPPPKPTFPVADQSWTNTLGMVFAPVSRVGPLFSIWETRVQDYRVFTNQIRPAPPSQLVGFTQGSNHPAVNIRWNDARAFCLWLTGKERDAGKLNTNQAYRLPRAAEWELAAGVAAPGADGGLPPSRSASSYLWGTNWPPPNDAGNFYGEEASSSGIRGFRDDFARTAPVGNFPANRHGLFDMAGNVWEWCEDPVKIRPWDRVAKGGSWNTREPAELRANFMQSFRTNIMLEYLGFRCVLDVGVLTNK
ncbi:MAG: protein kinase [Verrucomicrobia bacterium]|nr:protein kinase [Verrucomicrobiota bacterium]